MPWRQGAAPRWKIPRRKRPKRAAQWWQGARSCWRCSRTRVPWFADRSLARSLGGSPREAVRNAARLRSCKELSRNDLQRLSGYRASMIGPNRVEGYAIVSADGMIADAAGKMPDTLRNPADQSFLQAELDRAAMVVHGRHSHEGGPRAARRKRLIVTHGI